MLAIIQFVIKNFFQEMKFKKQPKPKLYSSPTLPICFDYFECDPLIALKDKHSPQGIITETDRVGQTN